VDIDCAFLNAPLKEDVYVELPEHSGNGGRIARLRKHYMD
jgi:hypothetical protein